MLNFYEVIYQDPQQEPVHASIHNYPDTRVSFAHQSAYQAPIYASGVSAFQRNQVLTLIDQLLVILPVKKHYFHGLKPADLYLKKAIDLKSLYLYYAHQKPLPWIALFRAASCTRTTS